MGANETETLPTRGSTSADLSPLFQTLINPLPTNLLRSATVNSIELLRTTASASERLAVTTARLERGRAVTCRRASDWSSLEVNFLQLVINRVVFIHRKYRVVSFCCLLTHLKRYIFDCELQHWWLRISRTRERGRLPLDFLGTTTVHPVELLRAFASTTELARRGRSNGIPLLSLLKSRFRREFGGEIFVIRD